MVVDVYVLRWVDMVMMFLKLATILEALMDATASV
jgi:hypothetical protein